MTFGSCRGSYEYAVLNSIFVTFVCPDGMVLGQEALKRILFIFAKLNPGIRYVQGMNEVLAPLYYVFKTDRDDTDGVSAMVSHHSVQGQLWLEAW